MLNQLPNPRIKPQTQGIATADMILDAWSKQDINSPENLALNTQLKTVPVYVKPILKIVKG